MSDLATMIVGGDGKVGKALARSLQLNGRPVIVTTRRPMTEINAVPLDLAECEIWEIPRGVSVLVLAAAITNMESCRVDPERSARVNVRGPLALAQQCKRRGIFVVFLSSSTVLDGRAPFAQAEAPLCPINEYGRQKANAERELRRLDCDVAIVRLTKVLEPPVPLFEQWRDGLRQREPIEPFDDMTIAPIPLSCIVSVLRLITDTRQGGIWQISGDRDITYAEIARRLAWTMGINESLVRPVQARGSAKMKEEFPAFTSLNSDRIREVFGVQAPPVEWTVDRTLRQTIE